MGEIYRSLYSVIPARVRDDHTLRPNAKLLYGELSALAQAEGYCWAWNARLAETLGISKRTVEDLLRQLRDRGHIQMEVERDPDSQEVADLMENIPPCTVPVQGPTVVVLSADVMGTGDDTLGRALMKGFVYALTQLDEAPDTVLLYNGGAKLSVEGAETVADLQTLAEAGAEILTCGTCLNHYGLTEKLAVGSVTNMYVIAETLAKAGKVIRP